MRQKINTILAQKNNEEKRIIAHIDMNSYFATVEQQARPSLRGKPIGVAGKSAKDSLSQLGLITKDCPLYRSIVAAASIEAKKRGVKTAMSIFIAKKICPEIIIVPGDMTKYEYVTQKFIKIFIDYTSEVEIFSVDEAFLDLSGCHSVLDAGFIDSGSRSGMTGWERARDIALQIKQRIKQEIGEWITCSVGLGPNKMLAKIASDKIKPDGLVVVKPKEVGRFMQTVELTDICGIGERIERRLNMLGIKTTADLANFSEKILVYEFGIYGRLLKMWGAGEDPNPLIPYYEDETPKSIGHSYTLPKDTYDRREIRHYLYLIADKVGRRLRKQEYAGRVINFYVRFYDFSGFHKVKTLQYPVSDSYRIYKICCSIFESIKRLRAVRMLGISLSGLVKTKDTTLPLIPKEQKIEKSLSACDKINNKYGESTITRAEFINQNLKEHVGGFLQKPAETAEADSGGPASIPPKAEGIESGLGGENLHN